MQMAVVSQFEFSEDAISVNLEVPANTVPHVIEVHPHPFPPRKLECGNEVAVPRNHNDNIDQGSQSEPSVHPQTLTV